MNLETTLRLSVDFMGPGAVETGKTMKSSFIPHVQVKKFHLPKGTPSHSMQRTGGGHAGPSNRMKDAGRNIARRTHPEGVHHHRTQISSDALEVTGPCGCTLKLGEDVTVEGKGRGKIQSRNGRILTVDMDNGGKVQMDQSMVHRPK